MSRFYWAELPDRYDDDDGLADYEAELARDAAAYECDECYSSEGIDRGHSILCAECFDPEAEAAAAAACDAERDAERHYFCPSEPRSLPDDVRWYAEG